MLHSQTLNDLAEAVADGKRPDWDSAESSAVDAAERALIRDLRSAASIGLVRATLYTSSLSARPLTNTPVLQQGDQWGSLRIVENVGRGHFGDVYRAWDPTLEREVALKLLRRDHAQPMHDETQVIDEGRLMARVRHPNVVAIYGAQKIDGVTGLWMEFVHGRTLEAELAERGAFPPEDLTRVGIELCQALSAVHEAGLVHRDVKAQNVLRDTSGRVVLGDFGTGRELDAGDARSAELAGTPMYVAPEIFNKQRATPRSDLYSLGALLFHLATGSYPVQGRSVRAIREAHAAGQRTTLRSARADMPAALTEVIDRALDPDPASRFADAREMARAMEQAVAPRRDPRRLRTWTASAAVVGLVAAAIWAWALRAAPIEFKPRDWILVTAFENRTGEPLLDGTIEHALERELSNSSFVNVVPHERIADTLLLMQKPVDSRIDTAIGKEIALRDGQIRAVLAGRVERIGASYAVSAHALNPADGSTVASLSESSSGQADLLDAVGRLAIGVRRRLGETLTDVQANGAALAKVTTRSLRALQLYSRAVAMENEEGMWRERRGAAEQLLREAVRDDPDFASAHMKLSAAVRVAQPSRLAEALEHSKRAVAASDRTSQTERLINTGDLYAVEGLTATAPNERRQLFERAVGAFEAVLQLQPDHHQALASVTNLYEMIGRPDALAAGRLADLRPNSVAWQARAASAALSAGHRDKARQYAHRSASAVFNAQNVSAWVWLRLFDAHDAWLQNAPQTALRVADRLAAEMSTLHPAATAPAANQLAELYLTLGQLDRAEQLASSINPSAGRALVKVRVARQRGDRRHLREVLAREYPNPQEAVRVASALVDAGLLGAAHDAIVTLQRQPQPPAQLFRTFVQGELALAEHRFDDAIAILERYLEQATPGTDNTLRGTVTLASAWAAKGDVNRAVSLLETASKQRAQAAIGGSTAGFINLGYWWLHVRDRLAQLYREAGRIEDAQRVESELLTLLAVADDDHPIKRRLMKR